MSFRMVDDGGEIMSFRVHNGGESMSFMIHDDGELSNVVLVEHT